MASNEQREKPAVKKGTVGPSRRAPSLESTGATRGKDELDARQARIREVRRKGPELKEGDERAALEGPPAQPVPPTECDDENDQ